MALVNGCIIALVAFVQLFDIFSIFHGYFHILFAQVVIFKSFFHFHSLHSIVLLPMVTSWYWGKSEVPEDIRKCGKGKVKMVLKPIRYLKYQMFCLSGIFIFKSRTQLKSLQTQFFIHRRNFEIPSFISFTVSFDIGGMVGEGLLVIMASLFFLWRLMTRVAL